MKMTEFRVPERYQPLDSDPGDPPYLKAYGYRTPGALCLVKCVPFGSRYAMPYGRPREVIDGIHDDLGDDQGLIEVETGRTKAGRRFLYSVVKTFHERPAGVQYCLTMHVDYKGYAFQAQGFFEERGTTGIRDAMVFTMLSNEGKVQITEDGIQGWNADPYDPGYIRGNRMNCSERKEYDSLFPDHALSETRRFAAELTELN